MAEVANTQALVPVDGEYQIEIVEFDSAGKKNALKVPVPRSLTSTEASVMLRSAILYRTTWKGRDVPTIIHAVMYADRMGLDIMAGDVYMAEEGRLSTTAGAKIRHAMSTGRIEGYNVEITEGKPIKIKYTLKQEEKVYEGPELIAKVTVQVVGWKAPLIYEAKLSEWFTGRNPNWRTRPAYMLRKNALSKALEEVAPMGVEADEAPPLVPENDTNVAKALDTAKALVAQSNQKEQSQ